MTDLKQILTSLGLDPSAYDAGLGDVRRTADEQRLVDMRRGMERRNRRQTLEASKLALAPSSLASLAERSYDATKATEAARAWFFDLPENLSWSSSLKTGTLVLLGGTGCGKTTAAGLLLLSYGGGHAITGRELARLSTSSWSTDVEAYTGLLTTERLLVIDDYGTEETEAVKQSLYDAVNARQAKATVVTSNLAPDAFKALVGGRTASRLAETGKVVWCGGNDLRRQK